MKTLWMTLVAVGFGLVLVGCGKGPVTPPVSKCADTDQDNFPACVGDCDAGGVPCDPNDKDARIHPGAESTSDLASCRDGIDNDADGKIDMNDPDCQDNYCADNDGDSFAVCSDSCLKKPGTTCGDCNDTNAAVHPGGHEGVTYGKATCLDGLDNDCNGKADGADAACTYEAAITPSGTAPCYPLKIGKGDCEFAGNGPDMNVTTSALSINGGSFLSTDVRVHAKETTPDYTEADYTCRFNIWSPPANETIVSVSPSNGVDLYYRDTNTSEDVIPTGRADWPIKEFRCMGDTRGNDTCSDGADQTECKVYFNQLRVKLRVGR